MIHTGRLRGMAVKSGELRRYVTRMVGIMKQVLERKKGI
jgi:hypothetical protein